MIAFFFACSLQLLRTSTAIVECITRGRVGFSGLTIKPRSIKTARSIKSLTIKPQYFQDEFTLVDDQHVCTVYVTLVRLAVRSEVLAPEERAAASIEHCVRPLRS